MPHTFVGGQAQVVDPRVGPNQMSVSLRSGAKSVEQTHAVHREDPTTSRARATLVECDRKLAKYLDGLEAGISIDLIRPRLEAAQREKAAAERVLATAPPPPEPLTFDEVVEKLSALHTLPELLGAIEQSDRAALYQALGLSVRYRRVGTAEEVRITTTLKGVELERVGGGT